MKVWWKRWQTIAYCHFLLPLDTVQGGYHYEFQKPSQGISLWSYSCSISISVLRPQLATTTTLKLHDRHPTACRGHCSWQLPSTKWWSFSQEHSSVQLLSCVPLFATPWTAACQASLSFTISQWPHGLQSPWSSPGQNTGVGSLFLLQGIFPTQE